VRLLTVASSPVDYPDLPNGAPLCVELVSAVPGLPVEALADEVMALSMASLVLQLEIGRPVMKLLNLSALLAADDADRDGHAPTLNYIAGLVEEPAYEPLTLLRRGLDVAPAEHQQRFADVPKALEQIATFIRAVGFDGSSPHFTRPSVHVSLDQAGAPGALGGGVTLRPTITSRALATTALWWVGQAGGPGARLCRPDLRREHAATPNLIPIPYLRDGAGHAAAPVAAVRRIAGGNEDLAGLSLRVTTSTPGGYLGDLVAQMLDAVVDLLPHVVEDGARPSLLRPVAR
jgi:hypothetical protein